jgi:cytochrome c
MHKFAIQKLMLSLAAVAALSFGSANAADDLGKKTFESCSACHSMKAGENGVGPSLHNVIGRTAGTEAGFRFSGPMKRSGIAWDEKNLTDFLRAPQEKVPGNRMPFSGVPDEAALKAVVQYLETASK